MWGDGPSEDERLSLLASYLEGLGTLEVDSEIALQPLYAVRCFRGSHLGAVGWAETWTAHEWGAVAHSFGVPCMWKHTRLSGSFPSFSFVQEPLSIVEHYPAGTQTHAAASGVSAFFVCVFVSIIPRRTSLHARQTPLAPLHHSQRASLTWMSHQPQRSALCAPVYCVTVFVRASLNQLRTLACALSSAQTSKEGLLPPRPPHPHPPLPPRPSAP